MTLIRMSAKGDYTSVSRLLKEGADVNEADSNGRTALLEAAWSGYARIARLLVSKGANVNRADTSGFTPLFRAVEEGYTDIVTMLLENGADVNTRAGVRSSTPLMLAAEMGDREVLRLLIDHGAKVNAVDQFGETALDRAYRLGRLEAVTELKKNSAVGKSERSINSNRFDDDLRPLTRAAVPQWTTVGEEAGLDELDDFMDDQFDTDQE